MAKTKLGETEVNTVGPLPAIGSKAPDFLLTDQSLKDISLKDFAGQRVILNIFPSIDTSVCAQSVRVFNKSVASIDNVRVVCVSRDLPFAHKRFCGAEGIEHVVLLSEYKNKEFGKRYGVELVDGPFEALLARAVFVLDSSGMVIYHELVPSIGHEPDYEKALQITRSTA